MVSRAVTERPRRPKHPVVRTRIRQRVLVEDKHSGAMLRRSKKPCLGIVAVARWKRWHASGPCSESLRYFKPNAKHVYVWYVAWDAGRQYRAPLRFVHSRVSRCRRTPAHKAAVGWGACQVALISNNRWPLMLTSAAFLQGAAKSCRISYSKPSGRRRADGRALHWARAVLQRTRSGGHT